MRKLAILIFQSLDGVMQAPSVPEEDYSGDFKQGGWAKDCWNDVMEQVGQHAMAETYDLLLGRNTYDVFSASFANAGGDNPAADKLNRAKKYVVTSDCKALSWENSIKISGADVAKNIAELKAEDGPLLQVHGSWKLVQTLLANKLVDEFRLWTFPTIVGSGKRLFAEGSLPTTLTLTKFEAGPSGALLHFYKPV